MQLKVYGRGAIAIKLDGDFTLKELKAIWARVRQDDDFRLYLLDIRDPKGFIVPQMAIRKILASGQNLHRRIVQALYDIGEEARESFPIDETAEIISKAQALTFRRLRRA